MNKIMAERMAFIRSKMNWLASQSDIKKSAICLGGTATVIPALAFASPTVLAATHILATSTQLGSQVFVGCIGAPTLAKTMSAKTLRDTQMSLLPKFGALGLSTGLLAASSYQLAHPGMRIGGGMGAESWLHGVTMSSFSTQLLNSFVCVPYLIKLTKSLGEVEVKLDSGKGGSRTELLAEQDRLAKRIKLVRGLVIFNYLGCMGDNMVYMALLSTKIAAVW